MRRRPDLGREVRASPFPSAEDFVSIEGEQQPRRAYYEPERTGAVSGLSKCPDAESGVGHGKHDPPDAELARGHDPMVLPVRGAR